MTNSRFYSNTAISTTLGATITSGGTSVWTASQTGMPTKPFLLSLEPDTANEELVLVTAGSGTVGSPWTVTRAQDGTSAVGHNVGVTAEHRVAALDHTDSRTHEDTKSAGHGLYSSVAFSGGVGGLTSSTTLSNTVTKTAVGKTYSLAGNIAQAGDVWRIGAFGKAVCTGTPTMIFNLQYGSNILATSDTILFSITGTTYWEVYGIIDFQSIGGSGSVAGILKCVTTFNQAAPSTDALFRDRLSLHSADLLTGVSTTSSGLLQIMGTWSAASSSNILTALGGYVEQIG